MDPYRKWLFGGFVYDVSDGLLREVCTTIDVESVHSTR